jgi:hypothetical protein
MKSKNRLKEVQFNLTNPNGSVFLTEQDTKDIAWLIRRVKVLEKTLKFYADEKNMHSLTGLPYGRRAREVLGKR